MDNPVLDFWNKLAVNMWSKYARFAGDPFAWFALHDKGKGPWQIPLKMTEAVSDSFGALTGDKKYSAGDVDSLSELVSNLMHTAFEGYLEIQKKWFDDVRKGAFALQDMGSLSHAPVIWLESIRKLFDLTSNGSGSSPSGDLLARYAAFSAKLSELLYQFYLPVDKASKVWAENMDDINSEGGVSQNIEEASGTWFSVLESSYLDLFKSPAYTQLLHETADAYEKYLQVRRQVYGPFPKASPKPQDSGVDALFDEISKVREKLEELLERVDSQSSKPL